MNKDYKIVKGILYIQSPMSDRWDNINSLIETFVHEDKDMAWLIHQAVTRNNITEDIEDMMIECWKRIKMERERYQKNWEETRRRINKKLNKK